MDADLYESLHDFPVHGIHHHFLRLANFCNSKNVPRDEALRSIHRKFSERPQRRPLQPNEIEKAVAKAYGGSGGLSFKNMGGEVTFQQVFTKTSEGSYWNNQFPRPSSKLEPRMVGKAIKSTPWSMEDMFEDSPLRVCDCTPPEIIQMLFDPNELVCCGTKYKSRALPVHDCFSISDVDDCIVPNPSRLAIGIGMSGKENAHCRDATGKRKYIVIESDREEQSFDDKASIIRYLRDGVGAELKMVVHSGGKSLHAWFKSSGNNLTDWKFMQFACELGADKEMWRPEQFTRTPNAVSSKYNLRQKCLYFDPS